VEIGKPEASWSAVSLSGILLCAGVHKNVIVVPEVMKV